MLERFSNRNDNSDDNTSNEQLARHIITFDNNWTMKKSRNENNFIKPSNQGEALLLDTKQDETSLLHSNQQHQMFSSDRDKSFNMVNNKQQSPNIHIFSPDELETNAQQVHSITKSNNIQSSPMQTKTNLIPSPIRTSSLPTHKITNVETQRSISKSPVRSNLISQSPILSTNKRQKSTNNKGAFHYFTTNDHQKQIPSIRYSSSTSNTPSIKDERKRISISDDDDDDDNETDTLKEDDLKLKLKEEKRQGKKTGNLLNKLHENYEELLEKYAQAENTIDQLRFQPKILGDNTPTSNTSEHMVHFIQQPKMNVTTLRSSGAYHSTTASPFSSIRPVPSTTTTTTTPVRKSISPTNSGTIESVFFDEVIPHKIRVQETTTSEAFKLDLIIQTKTLGDKMKSFLTLMDLNQLSLAEQKQIYDNIRQDYENLIKTVDRKKLDDDIDIDVDLNQELEIMKQLLKEIVKKITQNLLGKSINDSPTDRHLTHDNSLSSQLSPRSSLFNHNELMDQYQKLLDAVNTKSVSRKDPMKSRINTLDNDSTQLKTTSYESSPSDVSAHQNLTKTKQKPYVYISGNSDDEQQQNDGIEPISFEKGLKSTLFELDYIPSTSVKNHHQYIIEDQPNKYDITPVKKKKNVAYKDEYDNLENLKKSKRQIQKTTNDHQYNTQSNSFIPTDETIYSHSSMKTRPNDYDSGIGTYNITKLSHDSKLYTSTMDESHFPSLDDEQESISSSSRSSGSGSESPGSPYNKYTKRFNSSLSYRRKPSGHSDSCSSEIETHITGSFDPIPQSLSYNNNKKQMHRSHHTWKPQKVSFSRHSRLIPYHRSSSLENTHIENYKINSSHSLITPTISSKINHNQQPIQSQRIYRSSIYINQPHNTYKQFENEFNPKQSNKLYLDPQTGIIYRYETNKIQKPTRIFYEPSPQMKLYKCIQCGCITTYHHRHHINSKIERITNHLDDLGYESEDNKKSQYCRCIDYLSSSSSSDSDSDIIPNYFEIIGLNEVYDRAEKIQNHSQNLSKYINRQLKLALASI